MGVRVVETTTQTQFFASKKLFRFFVLFCILFCYRFVFLYCILFCISLATRFFILFL